MFPEIFNSILFNEQVMKLLIVMSRRLVNHSHYSRGKYYIQGRPKKRRKPYLRYLWLDLNKTKTGINHFKSTISTTLTNFFSKSNSRSDDNQLCFFKKLGIFFYTHFERDYFSESNDMPHVKMHLTVTAKINK
jgi:hypothetical protein